MISTEISSVQVE